MSAEMSLPYRIDETGLCPVLAINSQKHEAVWGELEVIGAQVIGELSRLKPSALLVDLSRLDYMSSAQVALIVRVWKFLKGTNARMAVRVGHPMVREVLVKSGLASLWEIVDDEASGWQALGVRRPSTGRRGMPIAIIGLIGFAVAIVGLTLHYSPGLRVPYTNVEVLRYCGAAIAAVAGVWCLARGSRGIRACGSALMVAGTLLWLFQMLNLLK